MDIKSDDSIIYYGLCPQKVSFLFGAVYEFYISY